MATLDVVIASSVPAARPPGTFGAAAEVVAVPEDDVAVPALLVAITWNL